MPAPQPHPLMDRIARVLDTPLCSTSALGSIYQEFQAEFRQRQEGVHPAPPHPVVQRLLLHRQAVLVEFLQMAEAYQDAQQRSADLLTAHRAAQRHRYEQNKAWRALPVGAGAEQEQAAEVRDQKALVDLERATWASAQAARHLHDQKEPFEAWEQRLLQAQQGVHRARQVTQPPRPRLAAVRVPTPTTPMLQVPAHAPAMRIRRP